MYFFPEKSDYLHFHFLFCEVCFTFGVVCDINISCCMWHKIWVNEETCHRRVGCIQQIFSLRDLEFPSVFNLVVVEMHCVKQ